MGTQGKRSGRRDLAASFVRVAGALVLATFGAALLAACSSNTISSREILNDEELATYRLPGASAIEGQVLLHLPSGETVYGGACAVRVTPVTTASTRYLNDVVLPGGFSLPKSRAGDIVWVETADAMGRFRFRELPAGRYYVTCPMAWVQEGRARQGIAFATVSLAPGETARIEVTRGTGGSGG